MGALLDWKSVYYACLAGHTEIGEIELLFCLDSGFIEPIDALNSACGLGYISLVSRLLSDSRVDPAKSQPVCLANACFYGQSQIVKLLLADGRADPNAFDWNPDQMEGRESQYTEIT